VQELLAHYLFHWTSEKAIWLGGHTLSWDARCAGIYAGFGCALLLQFFWYQRRITLPPWPILAMAAGFSLPMFIDVGTVAYGLRLASNPIKYLTGAWFGISFCCILFPAVAQFNRQRKPRLQLNFVRFSLILAIGSAVSYLTHWNHPIAFYLLEALAWLGFSGLVLLLLAGLLYSLWPPQPS